MPNGPLSDHDLIILHQERLKNIQRRIEEIEDRLEQETVTKDAFLPVKALAYGLTGALLLGVVGALLRLALR